MRRDLPVCMIETARVVFQKSTRRPDRKSGSFPDLRADAAGPGPPGTLFQKSWPKLKRRDSSTKRPGGEVRGVETGIQPLDEILGKLKPGLTILNGGPWRQENDPGPPDCGRGVFNGDARRLHVVCELPFLPHPERPGPSWEREPGRYPVEDSGLG